MGIWNTELYGNDTTADIRDTYIECLRNNMSDKNAYDATFSEYCTLMGTDEEPLFWFAIADTQWRYGRLLPAVKLNALKFISEYRNGFYDEFDDTKETQWDKVLRALSMRLASQMPPRKDVSSLQIFDRNPWNVGDVYAYRFHSIKSKEFDLFGKYIAIQKIGEALSYENLTFSVVQIYNKVFSSCPTLSDIVDVEVLPLVYPPNVEGTPKCTNDYIPSFDWYTKAIMLLDKPTDLPKKHLTFVGNSPLQYKEYSGNECSDMFWGTTTTEKLIIEYYLEWHKQATSK
ncbi:MAG: hypothetical protein E7525_04555 [Ruminococcaceae bacterium]|nr:hypothetical protein [Oscillospiraceae bacterium]